MHPIRAQFSCLLGFLGIAGNHPYRGPDQLGQLNRGDVHTAARTHHQHSLARHQPAIYNQVAPGCEEDKVACRGQFQVEAIGHGDEVAGGKTHVFGISAAYMLTDNGELFAQVLVATDAVATLPAKKRGVASHPLSCFPPADTAPHRCDLSRKIGAGGVGHVQMQAFPAMPHEIVQAVECSIVDLEQHVVRADLWHGHVVDDLIDIEAGAMFSKNYCMHDLLSLKS